MISAIVLFAGNIPMCDIEGLACLYERKNSKLSNHYVYLRKNLLGSGYNICFNYYFLKSTFNINLIMASLVSQHDTRSIFLSDSLVSCSDMSYQ